MPHTRRKWFFILGAIVLLLATLVLAREPILLGVGDFLIVKDNLQPADLIHVLGGDVDRIDYGIQLYKQGYAKKLFLTGGRIEIPLVNTTYSRLSKEYAVANGVRPEALLPLESQATSTYEEALELKRFLDSGAPIRSIIIVSSPYHLRRARWAFKKVLDDRAVLRFAPVPFEMARNKRRWWTDEESLRIVVEEYLKIPFYYAKYM
jgi:uncharacterized SAM-binding protein YcdF (DUF218 family)